MRKGVALLCLLALLGAPVAIAQEEGGFVSVNFVKVKPGMEQAFLAAATDHLAWHRETNDTHYYEMAQVLSGPRTGQYVFSYGPISGDQMDDYTAFSAEDFGDWGARGGFSYIDGIETVILLVIPGLGAPPPDDYQPGLVNVVEIKIDVAKFAIWDQGLREMDELQKQVGDSPGYSAWANVLSGDSFGTYWWGRWVDGWADLAQDPAREQRVMETAGGQEAYMELMGRLTSAMVSSTSMTLRPVPELSFMPGQ